MYEDAFDHSKRKHVFILNINTHTAILAHSKLPNATPECHGIARRHVGAAPPKIDRLATPVLSPQRSKAKPPSSASRWVRQQGASETTSLTNQLPGSSAAPRNRNLVLSCPVLHLRCAVTSSPYAAACQVVVRVICIPILIP